MSERVIYTALADVGPHCQPHPLVAMVRTVALNSPRQALDHLDDLDRLLHRVKSAAIAALHEAERGRGADSRRRWREAFAALDQADEAIDRVRYELLRTVRAEGLWWQQIGELVGLSAQAVQQR
jgi:hypothetical protein